MSRRWLGPWVLGVGLLWLWRGAAGCKESSQPILGAGAGGAGPAGQSQGAGVGGKITAGQGGAAGSTSGAGGSKGGASGGGEAGSGTVCPPVERSPSIPSSWVEDTSISCECRLYYAEGAEGVEPIEWKPCGDFGITGTSDLECQAMTINFDADPLHAAIIGPEWDNSNPENPRMAFRRMYKGSGEFSISMTVLVNPNSNMIDFALASSRAKNPVCYPGSSEFSIPSIGFGGFKTVVKKSEKNMTSDSYFYRKSGGSLEMIFREQKALSWQIYDSANPDESFLGRSPDISVWRLNDLLQKIEKISPSNPDGFKGGIPIPTKGALFLQRNIVARTWGVFRWDPASGVLPFLVDPDPVHKAYFSFATDGVDMVWTEGTASLPEDPSYDNIYLPFPRRDIMTAPYQVDPPPKGKRLRSDRVTGHRPFAVGCGRAAHVTSEGQSTLQIVRLSDGVSWEIKGDLPNAPLASRWTWIDQIGLTCDEIFFGAVGPPTELGVVRGTIVKIKLSSLGPGIPPD